MRIILTLVIVAIICCTSTYAADVAVATETTTPALPAMPVLMETQAAIHSSDEGESESEQGMESEQEGESESESEGEQQFESDSEVDSAAEMEEQDGMAFTEMSAQESSLPAMPAVPSALLESAEMSPPPAKSLPVTPAGAPKPSAIAPQLVTPGVVEDKWTQALTAVNAEIMQRATEINSEKAWTKQVVNLIKEYSKKHKKVLMNMNAIRGQVKELLKKKKQVQNAMIQRELTKKIKKTNKHLRTIGGHISHLKKKQEEFREKQKKLQDITSDIKKQLRKLRGQKPKKSNKKKL